MLPFAEWEESLRAYLSGRTDIAMAFLFGSVARNQYTDESDMDVAVYFFPRSYALEWEEELEFPDENEIWRDIERIAAMETDLLVLNRAPATVAYAVLEQNRPLFIKDLSLYWRFFLTVSSVAEDFREFTREYWEIKKRARSLDRIDKDRLIRILDSMESELSDTPSFVGLDRDLYMKDSAARRNVERWVENLVNSSIDLAKILLASRKIQIPQTYREILQNLSLLEEFDRDVAEQLSRFSRLRNILAHEYLDVRYKKISSFIEEALPAYQKLAGFVRQLV